MKLEPKQIYESIRLLERFCKAKECSLVFTNYYRLIVICTNLLNKYYNDKYMWLHSIQSMTGIPQAILQKLEVVFSCAIDFDFNYPKATYESDQQKLRVFINKYYPRYCLN